MESDVRKNVCKKLTGVKNGEGLSLRENCSKYFMHIVVTLIKGNLATIFPWRLKSVENTHKNHGNSRMEKERVYDVPGRMKAMLQSRQ